jgi:hypothetical protein
MSLLKQQNKFEESIKNKLSELETKPSDSLWDKLEKEMNTDSFEPSLRAKFEDFTLPVSEKNWTSIESQLPQERNKKIVLAFWFAVIFTSALGLGFLVSRIYFPAKMSEKLASETVIKGNAVSETIKNSSNDVQSTTQELTSNIRSNSSSASTKEVLSNSRNSEIGIPARESISANAVGNEQSQIVKSPSSTRNKKQNHNSISQLAVNSFSNSGAVPTAENQSSNPSGIIAQEQGSSNSQGSSAGTIQNNSGNLKPETQTQNNSEVRQLPEADSKIKLNDVVIKFDKDSIIRASEVNTDNYTNEEDKPGKFSISALVGVYRTEMLLTKPSSSVYDLDKAFELRSKLESSSIDWSGGFLLNYHFSENWMISSGVQISNFKQALHYDLAETLNDTLNQIQSQNLYLHPTDSIIEGHVKTLENKYSFTEIPIWLTYSFRTDKKVGFDFMIGYSFALLTSVNAYMPDPGCVGLLNVNDKASFPTIKGTSFINFAPAVNYRINNTVQLGLMPQFKLGLSSIIDNSNWIQEKPIAMGLNFYLRKRF